MPVIRKQCYALVAGCGTISPADSTTYYIGHPLGVGTETGALGQTPILIPKAGIIREVTVTTYSTTTTGTNEDINMYLSVDGTSDTLIQTIGLASKLRTFVNRSLNIPVTTANVIYLKMVCPAWATNPDGFRCTGTILVSY